MDFLTNADPLLKTFWYVALPTSLIFIIQTILTFAGVDSSDGIDADFDGNLEGAEAPFQLFSLRNLINFLLGFSWAGISFAAALPNQAILVSVSILVGILFVYVFYLIIRQVQKLAENNSFNIANTLHKTAEVYLPIPERKSGQGKVMISINGAFHELQAMTEQERIPSNTVVKVVKIESNSILIVEPV
jgi:membrane protein implicated in regulation of membrane protease activity